MVILRAFLLYIHMFLLVLVGHSAYNRYRYFEYNAQSVEFALSPGQLVTSLLGIFGFIFILFVFVRKVFQCQRSFVLANKFMGTFVWGVIVILPFSYQVFFFHDYYLLTNGKFYFLILMLLTFEGCMIVYIKKKKTSEEWNGTNRMIVEEK